MARPVTHPEERVRIWFRVTPDLRDRLRAAARARMVGSNMLAVTALETYLAALEGRRNFLAPGSASTAEPATPLIVTGDPADESTWRLEDGTPFDRARDLTSGYAGVMVIPPGVGEIQIEAAPNDVGRCGHPAKSVVTVAGGLKRCQSCGAVRGNDGWWRKL